MSGKVVRKRSKRGESPDSDGTSGAGGESLEMKWLKANWKTGVILIGIFLVALLLRSALAYPYMYEGDQPSLSGNDPYYHMRVVDHVLETHHHLLKDPALNYPVGGGNPRPPLFDWGLAIMALVFSPIFGDPFKSAWMLAPFYSPIWASLTVIPIYLIGKEMFGRKEGLLAAFFIATAPAHMERVLLGFFDHDSFVLFFILWAFYFLLLSLKYSGTENWVKDYGSLESVIRGLNEWYENSINSVGYAFLAGVSLAAVSLTWKGASYVFTIIFLYFVFEMFANKILKKDSMSITMSVFIAFFSSTLILLPYYLITNRLYYMEAPMVFFAAMVIFALIFVPTRDQPWIIVIPSFFGVIGLGLAVLYYGFPDLWYTLSTGMGYFVHSKLVSTIAEAQPGDFSRMTFSFGLLNYYLALVGFGYAIYEFSKDLKTHRVFLLIWGAVMIYMALSTVRFTFDATPIFSLLSAWMVVKIVEKVDPHWHFLAIGGGALLAAFLAWYYGVHMEDDYELFLWTVVAGFTIVTVTYILLFIIGVRVYNRKDLKWRYIAGALVLGFFLILPNVWFAVDASIPYEGKSDYDPEGKLLGAYGFGKTSDYWVACYDWMDEQDRGVPLEERPGFISWWDYGFWTVYLGEHPTVADNFQWGYQMAGSFIVAQNESEALALFITRIIEADYNDPAVKQVLIDHVGEENYTKLANILSIESKDKDTQDKFIDDVMDHPELYGKYDDLKIKNAKYAKARYFFTSRFDIDGLTEVLHDVEETTGHSIRYFAIDYRLFPFSAQNTGIFYAPVKLSDHKVEYYLEYLAHAEINYGTTKDPQWEPVGHLLDQDELEDYAKRYKGFFRVTGYELRYKQEFFNTMLYKCYIGYSGADLGMYDSDGYPDQGIPGLNDGKEDTKADQYPPMQGWMMKHFRLVYRTTYWNPHNQSELDKNSKFYKKEYEKDWVPMNYDEAVKKQQEEGGVISSGLRAGVQMLKYYDGAVFTGQLLTDGGEPVPGARITVQDEYGIPHESVKTDSEGRYSVILPFGDVKIIASKGGFPSGDNGIYSQLAQVEQDQLNTTTIHITDDQAMRKNGSDWYIRQNIIVKSASISGRVYWDEDEDGKYTAGTDTPVSNVTLRLVNQDYGESINYTLTSAEDGTYSFDSVIPGLYSLTGYIKSRNVSSSEDIQVSAGQSQTDQDIAIKPSAVELTLTLPNGSAVDGVEISLVDEESGITYTTNSSDDGKASFEKIIHGNYTVKIEDPRFLDVDNHRTLGEGEDWNENITLEPAVTLTGYLWSDYDNNGVYSGHFEALPYGVATFENTLDNTTYHVEADSTGAYTIKLPMGDWEKDRFAGYDVMVTWVEGDDYYSDFHYIAIDDLVDEDDYRTAVDKMVKGTATRSMGMAEVSLSTSPAYLVNGTVKNKYGVSVSNVQITFRRASDVGASVPDETAAFIANVNNKGEYRIYLPSGRYYMTASYMGMEGLEGRVLTVDVKKGQNIYNFNITSLKQVSGYVYWDLDGSGQYSGTITEDGITASEGQQGIVITAENDMGAVSTVSDSTGRYKLELPEGEYTLKIYDPLGRFYEPDERTVKVEKEIYNANISVDPIPVTFSGQLYADWNNNGMGDDGEEEPGVTVELKAISPGREDASALTQFDGVFGLSLVAGTYEVVVNYTHGMHRYAYTKTLDIPFAQNTEQDIVADVMLRTELELTYPLDDMSVAGAAILNNGDNNTGDKDTFSIRLFQGTEIITPTLNISGDTVTFEVKPGTYTIHALYKYSKTDKWYTYYDTYDMADGITVAFPLEKAVHMRGGLSYVSDGAHLSVHDVEMPIVFTDGKNTYVSSFDGWYYDVYLFPGEYTATLDYSTNDGEYRYVMEPTDITVPEDKTYVLKDLMVQKWRTLDGKVTFKGDPVSDVKITFRSTDGNTYETTSNETGYYSISMLSGLYNITVDKDGYLPNPEKGSQQVDLVAHGSIDIRLQGDKVTFKGSVKTVDGSALPSEIQMRLYEYGTWADMDSFVTVNIFNGSYEEKVEPGKYLAYAVVQVGDGYYAYLNIVDIPIGASKTMAITLDKASDFSGLVSYTDFNGVVHYTDVSGEMKLIGEENNLFKFTYENGTFRYILPYGDYRFTTSYDTVEKGMNVTYSINSVTVTVNRTTQSHNFVLTKEKTYNVAISYDGPREISVSPGETISIRFTVKNLGNTKDTISLDDIPPNAIKGDRWEVEFSQDSVELNLLEEVVLYANITVPEMLKPSNDYAIKAKSSGGSSIYDVLELTFTTPEIKEIDTKVEGLKAQGVRYGESVEYTIHLFNNGNVDRKFNMTLEPIPDDWNATIKYDGEEKGSNAVLTLGPYEDKNITVVVTAPTVEKVRRETAETKLVIDADGDVRTVTLKTSIDKPDVEIVSVTYDNIDLQDGPEFLVKATVRCNYVSLKSSVYVKLFINDTLIENKTIEALKQGEEKVVTFTVNATASNLAGNYHEITVRAQYSEEEKYDDNNAISSDQFIGLLKEKEEKPFNWNLVIFLLVIAAIIIAAVVVWFRADTLL